MDTEEQSPRNKQHIVPTFPNISKRPSVYKLFQPQLIKDEDKVINDLKTLNTMIKELDQEKYGFLSKRTLKRSNERQTTLKSNKLSLLRESDTNRLLFPSINAQETTEVIKTISMSKNLTTNESSEIDENIDSNSNSKGKQKILSNGKSLLEKDAFVNALVLALLVEISGLVIFTMFLFKIL